jgi:G3E family GTPase
MKKIPLTIITGFLGSGKTTLINQILKKNKDLKIALIVNEFGDVALESQFINTTDEEIVEMSNGCMCCVVRKDIIDTVQMIMDKRPDINYIIVEASWLSDPVPIAQTFLMNMEDTIRLDSVLCVIDCLNIEKNFEQFDIAMAQIQYADIVLLSKHAMLDSGTLERIEKLVYKFSPYTRILKITDNLPLSAIIDTNGFEHTTIEDLEINSNSISPQWEEEHHHCHDEHCNHEHHHEHHHHWHDSDHHHHHDHHHDRVDEIFIKMEKPISMDKFTQFLKDLPKGVFRWKWFLYSDDKEVENNKLLFQYVGARIDVIPTEWKENELKQNALVFIGQW